MLENADIRVGDVCNSQTKIIAPVVLVRGIQGTLTANVM